MTLDNSLPTLVSSFLQVGCGSDAGGSAGDRGPVILLHPGSRRGGAAASQRSRCGTAPSNKPYSLRGMGRPSAARLGVPSAGDLLNMFVSNEE